MALFLVYPPAHARFNLEPHYPPNSFALLHYPARCPINSGIRAAFLHYRSFIAMHPYSPSHLLLPNYVRNDVSTLGLCSVMGSLIITVVGSTWMFVRTGLSTADKAIVCWFLICRLLLLKVVARSTYALLAFSWPTTRLVRG